MAFVEEELRGQEAGEGGLAREFAFQGAEGLIAGLAFGAGEGDVGMEGTVLGDEATKGCGCRYEPGEGDE